MIYVRDKICESIQDHNKFIPCYNELVEVYKCVTDYEVESTLYREYIEESKALLKAQELNTAVKFGEIGPLKSIYKGVDYVEIYIDSNGNYLAKRITLAT